MANPSARGKGPKSAPDLGPGLGPTSRAWLAADGIRSAAELQAADPVSLWLRIRQQ